MGTNCYPSILRFLNFPTTLQNPHTSFFTRALVPIRRCRRLSLNCRNVEDNGDPLTDSSPYTILGVQPGCSASELKAAFRAKVKQFHPDVIRDENVPDFMIRQVLQAYEMLTNLTRSEIIESECLDPFDKPECEAFNVFVNETTCIGKGCSSSCVERAPHVFSFSSSGTARATFQGHEEDYRVQLAVGQCPQSCIYYVTPSQRIILEELLDGILEKPYNCSVEADLLYSLIMKARFENNRYQKPKKKPKSSTKNVDFF